MKTYLNKYMNKLLPIKTMEGECSSATLKSSRTSFGPSPRYLEYTISNSLRKTIFLIDFNFRNKLELTFE